MLDDAAFGAATPVVPKLVSPADPAARWTGADGGLAYFAYAANYLIDLDHAVIVDVEPTTAIRQAEVTAAKRMIVRSRERFDLYPARLAGDSGYGSAAMLGWLVHEQGIEPHGGTRACARPASSRPSPSRVTGASPSTSRIRRASALPWWTMAGPGRSIPGTGPRFRPPTRSAASARSGSRCRTRPAPPPC